MLSAQNELREFIKNPKAPVFEEEDGLASRLLTLRKQFREHYHAESTVHVRSPGRAEIIGNHTDYNNGYALAAAISKSTLAFFRKRDDTSIRIRSNSYPGAEVIFDINNIFKATDNSWSNYARAVVKELSAKNIPVCGADILVDSNVPGAGGVSSSASFEVALATGLSALCGAKVNKLDLALLCKQAENGPLVGAPCGLLDQAAVVYAQSSKMAMLDFQPSNGVPLTVKLIPASAAAAGLSWIITVDPEVKRNLGESGYPVRRRMCEQSLPILSRLLSRDIPSLREVSNIEFERVKDALQKEGGEVMRKRVQHVVYENQRVLDAVAALEKGDFKLFGALLTASGHSALELYGLDEKTPELTFLVEESRKIQGVVGTRNMGGGFSGIILTLLPKAAVGDFQRQLAFDYQKKWGRPLSFVNFNITQGVETL